LKSCLACQVSQNKCSIDGEPMGPKKRPQEDKPESCSPKKAQTTVPDTEVSPVPQVDKEGWAAYKVSGERWTMESSAPGVGEEGSTQPQVRELLDESVRVGEEQVGLLREMVELLKEVRGGIKDLNKVLRGSKVGWVAAGDEEEEGEVVETIEDE
jgi:hypothetical protein